MVNDVIVSATFVSFLDERETNAYCKSVGFQLQVLPSPSSKKLNNVARMKEYSRANAMIEGVSTIALPCQFDCTSVETFLYLEKILKRFCNIGEPNCLE